MGRSHGHRPGRASRVVAAEFAVLTLALALHGGTGITRAGLVITTIALATAAAGRGPLDVIVRSLTRPPRASSALVGSDVLADLGGLIAVIELGRADALLATAGTPLPRPDEWPATLGQAGPTRHVQLLVHTSPPSRRAFLAIRVGGDSTVWRPDTLHATLAATVAKVTRGLTRDGVPHRRLTGPALTRFASRDAIAPPSWRHLTTGSKYQVTLRVPMPPEGMTNPMLIRLAEHPAASAWLTWSADEAIVHLGAGSAACLDRAIAAIKTIGGATRPRDTHRSTRSRSTRPRSTAGDRPDLAIAPAGFEIARDRNDTAVHLNAPAGRGDPVRITVVGDDRAADLIAERAMAAGVPVGAGTRPGAAAPDLPVPIVISIVERPTSADTATLTGADIVVCHALPADEAAIVAAALGLSERVTVWLTRIEAGMVALIGEGVVRWAMLSAETGAPEGLAGARRT